MPAKKAFTLFMLMVLCLLPIKDTIAAPIIQDSIAQDGPPVNETSTGIAPTTDLNRSGIGSLSGSNVTFDTTAGGDSCYTQGAPQTLCFKSESFTTDYEYVYNNWIKFPSDWTVSNVYVQGTPVCDVGSWGGFSWAFQTSPYEVNITHTRYQSTADHCVATYCVDVTPAENANPAGVSWFFDGDGYGAGPHNPCSSDGYTPAGQNACDEMVNPVASVPKCGPQVVLSPAEIETSGCHAEPKSLTLTIGNYTGVGSTFEVIYDKDFPGDIVGPSEISLANGESLDFNVTLDPHLCSYDAEYTATVTVTDGTYSDQTDIDFTVYSELHEWKQITTDPNLLMDNVVAGYDGKVWSLTGYGSTNGVTTYDPGLDTWTLIPASSPPWGGAGYPRSGCQIGNEVFIYGDASGAITGLWSYNMDTNIWAPESPAGTPPPYAGIWAPSWVGDTETGLCYLTGGATAPGAGNLTSVYVYDTITNAWMPELPAFTTIRDFHAAFLFVRPSDSHRLLCLAGGNNNNELSSTQCYDFNTGIWNTENADLGALPGGLWAMGYTQRMTPDGEQLWMVGGVFNTALVNQTWYYDVNTGTWIDSGLLQSVPVYRTAAATVDDIVYHVGGSTGGFTPTGLSDKRLDITCPECELPGFTKQATEFAYPGQTIHYSISLDPMVQDTALVYDYLPSLVEYIPGSLSVTPDVGTYDYDSTYRVIWWYNGQILANENGWTPAEKSGNSLTADITTHSEVSVSSAPPESIDYAINAVLWDQPLSSVSTAAYVNQEFSDFPDYSSFLADDFVVSAPWVVDSIFVPGDGWNGFTSLSNASALTFMIYQDNAGVPAGDPSGAGAPPFWSLALPPTDPQITITNGSSGVPSNTQLVLDEPFLLPTGHYWLVFYPTMSFSSAGQFGRQPADTVNLLTAQFVNPGGAFGFGSNWQSWMVLGPTQPDIAFRIEGEEVESLLIEYDAKVFNYNQEIWNSAYLDYGSYLLSTGDMTFTGYGVFLPLTVR